MTSIEGPKKGNSFENNLNAYHLPPGWSVRQSRLAMDHLAHLIAESHSYTLDELWKVVIRQAMDNAKHYPDANIVWTGDIRSSVQQDPSLNLREYYSMNRDAKIRFLQERYSTGFPVRGHGGKILHLPWDAVLDCEFWAINAHGGQSITSLMLRGGCSPQEFVAMYEGVRVHDVHLSDEFIFSALLKKEGVVFKS